MKEKEKLRKNKFMRSKKSFIFLLILCLGIGFAFLSSQLTITGSTSVSGSKWNVYFSNVQVNEESVEASVVPTASGTSTTSLNYTVTLNTPGDFYEFTVDAVNNGTIDAMIQNVNMSSLSSDVAKYLSFTATYEDGTALAQNDVLAKNSTTTYRIRVEFLEDVVASDLNEEGVILNLSFGVNYIQSNLKSKKFTQIAKATALSDGGINFTQISSDTNGKGLYVKSGTKNNTYPIYYYRGDVDNNNVKFAGFCWKIVRTTDTGGTKLIYNGVPSLIYKNFEDISRSSYKNLTLSENYSYTFDDETKKWTISGGTSYEEASAEFTLDSGDYYLNYSIQAQSSSSLNISYNNISLSNEYVDVYDEEGETLRDRVKFTVSNDSQIVSVKYRNEGSSSDGSLFTFFISKGSGEQVMGCDNSGDDTIVQSSMFNDDTQSGGFQIKYIGYMYPNDSLTWASGSASSEFLYGKSFTYSDGMYTLTNISSSVDIDNYHYTCKNSTGQCATIYYVYPGGSAIALNDGKSIQDELENMFVNTNDSMIKTNLESWFNNTFRSYFTNQSKDYNDYLEDTIWCNDREIYDYGAFNPNGGNSAMLAFESSNRINQGNLNLSCTKKNDSFTVTETAIGNGKMTYPVGLLTVDELTLAGAKYNTSNQNIYLNSKVQFWTMSPSYHWIYGSSNNSYYALSENGRIFTSNVKYLSGIRPSISIKPNIKIRGGGDGSSINPYEFLVD